MNSITGIKQEVISLLKSSPLLGEVSVVAEFSDKQKVPVKSSVLTVGIHGVEVEQAGFGGYFGQNHAGVHSGAWATIELVINCYSDLSNKSHDSQLVFEKLCSELIHSHLGVVGVVSQPIVPVKGSFVSQLSVRAKIRTLVSEVRPKEFVDDFILKGSVLD